MPNYTVKLKDGTLVDLERKNLKEAEARAKTLGGEIIHKGNDKPKAKKNK